MTHWALPVLLISTAVVSGCATKPENAYPEAQNARECEVLYQADQRRTRQAQATTTSSGNALADAIGRGIGKGVSESILTNRYQTCLMRVGAAPGYATAPKASVQTPSKTRVVRNVADLPAGYPLQPGDEYLWASLSPAQKQRALEFLRDGSTIRSSLQTD